MFLRDSQSHASYAHRSYAGADFVIVASDTRMSSKVLKIYQKMEEIMKRAEPSQKAALGDVI